VVDIAGDLLFFIETICDPARQSGVSDFARRASYSYFVIVLLGGGAGVGAEGEIAKVSQTLNPP
jgi:hypothetical protein